MMLISLHKFLTCEGRYVVTFIYHLNLLSHFEGGPHINFPHFLWMSLKKMARGVRSVSKKPETSLHHHGLIKLLVVHALKTQGGSWKQLLQQSFSQEKSKSVETQEAGTHSEGSRRKAKKDRKMTSGGKEDTAMPNSSQPIEKSVTEKSVVGEPVISRKKTATQFQRVSPTSVQRSKRRKEGSEPGGQSDSIPETIVEMSSEPSSQIEKTPDFHLQSKKKSAQAKVSSSVLHPKDQRSQNKKQKKEETDQQEILLEPTIKTPLKSSKELKSISEVTRPSQNSVGELKETAKVTSKNKKKLEGKEAQVPEPTPQSSRIGIWVFQQKKTPEFTIQARKIKFKSTQEEQVSRPTPVSKSKKMKLFEETPTPVSKSKKASPPICRTTRSMAK
jgi:hypothetical protein